MLISTTNVTNLSNALRAFIDAKTPSGAVRKYRLQAAAEDLISATWASGGSARILAELLHEEGLEDSKWLREKLLQKRWHVGRNDEPEFTDEELARVSAIAANAKSYEEDAGALFAINSLMATVLEAKFLKADTEPSLAGYAFRRAVIALLIALTKRGDAMINKRISELAHEQEERRKAETA